MIKVEKLCKQFSDNIVLDNLNIIFAEGETTCIMGPSGCGKTTLLNIMLGLLEPDGGKIYGLSDKRLSAVFQEDRLCNQLNSVDNVAIVCHKSYPRDKIKEMLERLGLSKGDIIRPVRELSGGMKRRVAIARALCTTFDVIFMDEPFKGLDIKTRENVIITLKNELKGKTAIVITHDVFDAEALGANLIELCKA